ncbi:MAG: hypothetical protein KY462_16870 [Actinobacteria bacterium]|nr:hypothetical protein [Actinomycetota bacterium]
MTTDSPTRSSQRTVMPYPDAVLIRHATPGDTDQLIRVAARHHQPPIHGPALIAEVDGVARAALELADGRVVTDPFVPTADVVGLLQMRLRQLAGVSGGRSMFAALTHLPRQRSMKKSLNIFLWVITPATSASAVSANSSTGDPSGRRTTRR